MVGLLAAPSWGADTAKPAPGTAESAQPGDNTPPPGFIALFNGKDLTNWKGLMRPPLDNPARRAKLSPEERAKAQEEADRVMRAGWSVQSGILVFNGHGRNLSTAKDYGDFELWVDWKIGPRGDSGLYLRGTPQVQIWDHKQWKIGSGGLYNNFKHPSNPLVMADNPIGQWNRFYVKMVGEKVTVILNGKLVVDQVPLDNYWERDKPIYATGPIELQNHGDKLWFKNIYLREIPRDK
jgi:hypothetical protein